MFEIDHLVVSALTLEEGTAYVQDRLGVPLDPGGQHPDFGTHNRLLSLGPEIYLEVIAIDPDAPDPGRPRWFGLDDFGGAPGLTNWVLRTLDIDASLASGVPAKGDELDLTRGTLRWSMIVPPDGNTPHCGLVPALIKWQGEDHPCRHLADRGVRLKRLALTSYTEINPALAIEPYVVLGRGRPGLSATFDTPSGDVVL